ncbi:hypothetical protein KIAC18_003967 [Sporomusa sphaeroides]|uniref:hypothetical protein n=1 Tax=Sporomusa sphaeroides TaxID=47679 RepID=UPI003DA08093
MYFIDDQMYRCFTVSMAFEREITDDEFSAIIQKVPQLIISAGIADRVTKCLKTRSTTNCDTNETVVKFIMDLTNRVAPDRIRRSSIESVLQEHYEDAEVNVLVD